MVKYLIFSIILAHFSELSAQNLYALHSVWDDDVKQWEIQCEEGDTGGEVEMAWRLRNDFTEWNYRLEGKRGTIKQKWDNNPNKWELRSGDVIVSISTIWTNDFSSFRIEDGNSSIKIERTNFLNDPIEWSIVNEDNGRFTWYNEFEFDLRDWIIIDELPQEYSLELRFAAVFITVLNAIVNQK